MWVHPLNINYERRNNDSPLDSRSRSATSLLSKSLISENLLSSKASVLERQSVKLLTQNFFMLPIFPRLSVDQFHDERFNLFAKHFLNNYDIICGQELFGPLCSRPQDFFLLGQLNGFPYHAQCTYSSATSAFGSDGGIVTMSRFPIVEKQFSPFKYGVHSDSCAMKGVLFTKIQIRGEYLLLFNTHLNACYIDLSHLDIKASLETRQMQFEHIRDFINIKLDEHRHKFPGKEPLVLLAGDLNVNANKNRSLKKVIESLSEISSEAMEAYNSLD